jgi:hypothetical protein
VGFGSPFLLINGERAIVHSAGMNNTNSNISKNVINNVIRDIFIQDKIIF